MCVYMTLIHGAVYSYIAIYVYSYNYKGLIELLGI